jgi:cell fate (sporulation/competence/biofilm development) regulator YmcA (YheA/YmcA/DUF963 family)
MSDAQEQKELKLKAIDILKKSRELSKKIIELEKTTKIKNISKLKKRIQSEIEFMDKVQHLKKITKKTVNFIRQ